MSHAAPTGRLDRPLFRLGAPVSLALVLLAIPTNAGADTSFTTFDLGALGGGSEAVAVSATGQVVGYSATTSGLQHAFSWTQADGMVDLGTPSGAPQSFALAVNSNGQIAGYSEDGNGAFSWTPAGGFVDLGTLGGSFSYPGQVGANAQGALNDSGQIVGYSYTASGSQHAFSWTQTGGMVDLGVPSWGGYSAATAVNDNGQVVGNTGSDGFSWTLTGGMVDLGALAPYTWSTPNAINNNGEVVGVSATATGAQHAFAWTEVAGMMDLGTLGGTYSQAYAVNDNGQIVGVSTTPSGDTHAFSWTPAAGMTDVGTLGGNSSSPAAVNNAGQVVGESKTTSGTTHAFFWTSADGIVDLTPGSGSSRASGLNDAGQAVGVIFGGHATMWQLPSTFRYSTAPCLGQPGHAVLQPINSDNSSVFRLGSTVPVKFRVCDANGTSVGPGSVFDPTKGAAPVLYAKTSGTGGVDEQVYSTTPDSSFRWDPTAQQWVFNQSTKNLLSGVTYTYRIHLNDGSFIAYTFGVK